MKLWKRAGPVALSLALCAGLVSPALAHEVTIEGQRVDDVKTVQDGVNAIGDKTGTITMTSDEQNSSVTINQGNVTLDLNGWAITNNDRNGAAITVSGGELTLQDSSGDKSGKVEATDNYGVGVKVKGGATANILGGEVKATGEDGTGVEVNGGTANIWGGEVEAIGEDGTGVKVAGGTANIWGGEVKATGKDGNGMYVSGGTANISGGAVSGEDNGVDVNFGGTVNISGGTVSGDKGVGSHYGTVKVSGGVVRGEDDGVYVGGGTLEILGGTVSGNDSGVYVNGGGSATISDDATVTGNDSGVHVYDGTAEISGDAIVTGKTGVQVDDDGAFNMTGGTVGSTVGGGAAVVGTGTITLNGGTIYGSVPVGTIIGEGVIVEAAPYVPPAPDPDPASDPLTRPAAARTLLEELFRRAGASGDLWSWAVENGLIDEDADGEEIVTVGLLRAILTRYAEAFGGNAVAVEDLTTLTGADTDIVRNCRAVLDEFFGE